MITRSEEEIADNVLRRTLIEVRAARTRRRAVKSAVAVSTVLTLLGIMIFPRRAPVPEVRPPRVVAASGESRPAADETLAVMVWRDGTPSLEMIGLRDLGSLELQFSLDPVAAFSDDGL
jgi:hypothetical protein